MRTLYFNILMFFLAGICQAQSNYPLPEFEDIVGDPSTMTERVQQQVQYFQAQQEKENNQCEHKLFLSTSISVPDLEQWRNRANAYDSDIEIVFRGLFTRRIPDTIMWINKVFQGGKAREGVSAVLNPMHFDEFGIESVPAQAYRCNHESLVIYGAVSMQHIREEFMKGKRGVKNEGPTIPIAEKSLLKEFEERAATANLGQKAKENVMAYFNKKRAVVPHHAAPLERELDMRFTIPQEYVVNRSTAAAAANPVDLNRCVTFDLVIYDAKDEKHEKWAEAQVMRTSQAGRRPIIISTGFKDWNQLNDLRIKYNQNIYLLEDDFRHTFDIQGVPTLVTQNASCKFVSRGYTDAQL